MTSRIYLLKKARGSQLPHFTGVTEHLIGYIREAESFRETLQRVTEAGGTLPSYRDMPAIYTIGELTSKRGLFAQDGYRIDYPPHRHDTDMPRKEEQALESFFNGLHRSGVYLDLIGQREGDLVTFKRGISPTQEGITAAESFPLPVEERMLRDLYYLDWGSLPDIEGREGHAARSFLLGTTDLTEGYMSEVTQNGRKVTYTGIPNIALPPEGSTEPHGYVLLHNYAKGRILAPVLLDQKQAFSGGFGIRGSSELRRYANEGRERLINLAKSRLDQLAAIPL